MNIVYIEKVDNIDEVLTKWQRKIPLNIKSRIVKNKVLIKSVGGNADCKVFFDDKIKDKVLENVGKKIKDTVIGNGYKNVVISNKLKKNKIIMEKLQELNILDGRWIFNYLVGDIISYIALKKNKEINKMEISVLVNKTTSINMENIMNIAKNAKILNIVTENLAVFNQFEERLYDELGIMIRVTNNKKKSLLKSDIIINLDFSEAEVSKYYLPSKRNNS